MLLFFPPLNQSCLASNQVVEICRNTDFWLLKITREACHTRDLNGGTWVGKGAQERDNRDIGKVNTAVLYKDENFLLWLIFDWHQSYHGNVTTPLRLLLAFEFLGTISRELVPPFAASITAKFERFLWERFGNILERSFKGLKNSK